MLAGELNYQIYYYVKNHWNLDEIDAKNIKKFVDNFLGEKRNYQKYNDVTGALIRCYIEIKRRLNIDADVLIEIAESYDDEIAIYENLKCIENGDV